MPPTPSQRITSDKLAFLRELPKEERVIAVRKHFGYFLAYYLGHYINYPFADYHYDMMRDVHDLLDLKINELAWFEYRESAKTSFAKGLMLMMICYDLDPYINADSLDSDNSERILFDVVWELQTNPRIIEDFGELYNSERKRSEATQKQIKNFVTNPRKDARGNIVQLGIRVEAHSTQEPVRGRTHGASRPGFVLLDDFETKKSIKSEASTKAVYDHIQEFKGGLDTKRHRVLYLGNVISEYANVQMIIERAKNDPMLRVRVVPIHDGSVPSWPQKYTMTDIDAKATGKVSIESIRRNMWTPNEGDADFMAEMLCQPIDETKSIFKREFFQKVSFEEIKKRSVGCYVTIDTPSIKDSKPMGDSDYIGFCINWVDVDGRWNLKAWREKLGPVDLLKKMFSLYRWLVEIGTPPIRFAWEDTAYTRGLEVAFRIEQKREGLFNFPFWWLKHGGRNKEDRIRSGLLYRYESRSIFHLDGECDALQNELLRFPNSQNDDCSDATAYQHDIANSPVKKEEDERSVVSTPNHPFQRNQRSVYEQEDGLGSDSSSPFAEIGM